MGARPGPVSLRRAELDGQDGKCCSPGTPGRGFCSRHRQPRANRCLASPLLPSKGEESVDQACQQQDEADCGLAADNQQQGSRDEKGRGEGQSWSYLKPAGGLRGQQNAPGCDQRKRDAQSEHPFRQSIAEIGEAKEGNRRYHGKLYQEGEAFVQPFQSTLNSAVIAAASGILKPLNNSQKGRRMISNTATGRARTITGPPGDGSRRSNQLAMPENNTSA
jgi:hypothetical protein